MSVINKLKYYLYQVISPNPYNMRYPRGHILSRNRTPHYNVIILLFYEQQQTTEIFDICKLKYVKNAIVYMII